eukprot:CAMPEP_0116851044 /NCGR_PEP_ID=MMETSP0418-20121206/16494_1 /TAXON_ID=1158023 /ORGANISM="Astrosyne radiata, Strain 13vi08-1A" /LENGTH=150 /DNA_ID=CAMNT_0004483003 /DNA_START=253 /DNA_END=706 /DNA_ORIENTATION=+
MTVMWVKEGGYEKNTECAQKHKMRFPYIPSLVGLVSGGPSAETPTDCPDPPGHAFPRRVPIVEWVVASVAGVVVASATPLPGNAPESPSVPLLAVVPEWPHSPLGELATWIRPLAWFVHPTERRRPLWTCWAEDGYGSSWLSTSPTIQFV